MATNKGDIEFGQSAPTVVGYAVASPYAASPYATYSYEGQTTGQPPVYSAGTYSSPPQAVGSSTGYYAANPQAAQTAVVTRNGPPEGHWRDGICDCFSNIWPSCGCNFIFHGAWLVAQSIDILNIVTCLMICFSC